MIDQIRQTIKLKCLRNDSYFEIFKNTLPGFLTQQNCGPFRCNVLYNVKSTITNNMYMFLIFSYPDSNCQLNWRHNVYAMSHSTVAGEPITTMIQTSDGRKDSELNLAILMPRLNPRTPSAMSIWPATTINLNNWFNSNRTPMQRGWYCVFFTT